MLIRPNLLLELLLIRVTYAGYARVRLAATGGSNEAGRARAEEHGQQILDLERVLHLDIEHAVNHAVVKIGWLRQFFDFYYTSFHFVVPLTVLGLLYWRRPSTTAGRAPPSASPPCSPWPASGSTRWPRRA